MPSDVVSGKTIASKKKSPKPEELKRTKPEQKTVFPSDFKIRSGTPRLIDIRRELVKLKREDFPNAGAVLLRVFFELSVLHYFEQTGELADIKEKLKSKNKLQHDTPTLRQLSVEITHLAKKRLPKQQATMVEKAVRYDRSAPFTVSELNTFVHQQDFPSARDIQQFWIRIEPLLRLMLENTDEGGSS